MREGIPPPRRRTIRWDKMSAVGFLALLNLLLFHDLLFGERVLYFGDISLYFVPLLDFQKRELSQGRFPLWNPYLLCGTPFIGNPQAWPLYPSSALLSFFSAERVASIIGPLHVFLAGAGTLLFLCRCSLRTHAALVGAVAWSFGGAVVAKMQFPNMIQAAALLPWLLWAIEGAASAERGGSRKARVGILALIVGLTLLAGHAQVFLLNFYFSVAWLLWRVGLPTDWTKVRRLAPFVFAFALGAGLAGGTLLPVAEFTRVTVRAHLTLAQTNRFILPPYTSLYNFLLPNFFGNPAAINDPYIARGNFWEVSSYIGLLPFALAIGAIVRLCSHSGSVRFWAVAAGVGVWLSLGADAYLFAGAYYVLPGVRLFHDPARWLLPGTFALCCLAAYAVNAISQTLAGGKQTAFFVAVLTLTAADLLPFAAALNPTAHANIFSAARTGKTWTDGRVYLSNYGDLWGTFVSYRSYAGVRGTKEVRRFLSAEGPNLPVLAGQPMLSGYEPVRRADINRYLSAVDEERDQGALLTAAGVTRWERWGRGGNRFRNLPGQRAALWKAWRSARTDEAALATMLREKGRGLPIVTGAAARVRIKVFAKPLLVQDMTAQSVRVTARDGGFADGLVVLADTHGAGWNVRIDGKNAEMRTVNGVFRGVLVSQGARAVVFRYEPTSWRAGMFVTLCAGGILSGVFACAAASRFREKGNDARQQVGVRRQSEERKTMADLVIETRMVNATPVLDLSGEVDSYNSPKLREKMIALIDQGTPHLVINMGGVDYIDSTGLGTLVGGLKRATEKGGAIRIICPNEQIYKVFNITGLVKVFPIFDTEQAAFATGS